MWAWYFLRLRMLCPSCSWGYLWRTVFWGRSWGLFKESMTGQESYFKGHPTTECLTYILILHCKIIEKYFGLSYVIFRHLILYIRVGIRPFTPENKFAFGSQQPELTVREKAGQRWQSLQGRGLATCHKEPWPWIDAVIVSVMSERGPVSTCGCGCVIDGVVSL